MKQKVPLTAAKAPRSKRKFLFFKRSLKDFLKEILSASAA